MTSVFIIGGGPAGLAAAIAARRKGFQVTVADGGHPPLDKACGEGMMPGTLSALQDLGIRVPSGAGAPFCGIRFIDGRTRVEARFPRGTGIGMRRPALHSIMLKAAVDCGVKLLWNSPVTGIRPEGVALAGNTVPARWIVGADGSQSLIRRWAGLDSASHHTQRLARRRHYRARPWSRFVEIYWGRGIQAYVTPVAADEMCVVLVSQWTSPHSHADVPDGPILWAQAWAQFPELAERLHGAAVASAERGSVTAMHSLRRVHSGNIALLGDASGGVDAITGEGLRLSFLQALALADAMEANNLRQYQIAHGRLARRPAQMGRLMLLLGKYAPLRSHAVRALAAHPDLFARTLAVHVGETSAAHLAATTALLGWRFLAA